MSEQQAGTPPAPADPRLAHQSAPLGREQEPDPRIAYGALHPSDYDALEKIDKFMDPPGEAPQEPVKAEEATPEREPDTAPEVEEPEAPQVEDEATEETSEGEESEAAPDWELPEKWTLNELAEAIGVDSDALQKSLRAEVDGEEVPISEVLRGTLREADYTRKTMALADERKAFDAERETQAAELQQKLSAADQFAALMAEQAGGFDESALMPLLNPDSDYYDPEEYHRRKLVMDQQRNYLGQYQEFRQQEQAQQLQAFRAKQQKIARNTMPELQSDEGTRKFQDRLHEGMTAHYGFSGQQVEQFMNGAWDVRQLRIIDDALKFRALEAGKKSLLKKLKGKPPVVRPGTGTSKGDKQTEAAAAIQRRLRGSNKAGRDAAAMDLLDLKGF